LSDYDSPSEQSRSGRTILAKACNLTKPLRTQTTVVIVRNELFRAD